jgi:hypothetical protein
MTAAMGVKDVRKWYDRNWFATTNFHGMWYSDSDLLEKLVPFRGDSFADALARAIAAGPASVRLAGKIPAAVIKHLVMKPLTKKPRGTMAWIENNDHARINAYFGSREAWESLGDWSTFIPPQPDKELRLLDHGYDESKPRFQWSITDMTEAAEFRGGHLLSETMATGDISAPLTWQCASGHTFRGSPRLILAAGHWCPECVKDPTGYASQAAANRFLAQLEPAPAVNA